MQSAEVPKHQDPYENIHISMLMEMKGFKDLPEEIQTLTRQVLELSEQQPFGITQKLPWPKVLLPQVARLRAGEKENIRFLTPFTFLFRLEEFLTQLRRQQQLPQ